MKTVKIDLPQHKQIEIHTFADEHIGDTLCDMARLKERIKYVAETENAYCILNGDIIDNATKTSIGDIYSATIPPMKALETVIELFEPIKSKILLITQGNHENRTYVKEGIDLSSLMAMQFGIHDRYTPTGAVIFLRFGKDKRHPEREDSKILYTLYATHGRGGGRKEGAKAIRLADMASIVDCDIYLHGHTHLPMIMKQSFFKIDERNSTVAPVTKLFVNTAANLNYGGYGQAGEFKPNTKDTPIIYLSGTRKDMKATL